MRVGRGRISLQSDLTIDQDIDFLTLYQAKRLASPASGEALRKGNKDITNAEIADAAAIVISKLVNTYLPETLLTTRGDMCIRGASNPARLAKGTSGKVLVMGADEPAWSDIPTTLTVAETEVFSGTSSASWTDLDLSGVVGANVSLVLLKVFQDGASGDIAVRKNGDTDEFWSNTTALACGAALTDTQTGLHLVLMVTTDSSGIIEIITATAYAMTVDIIAFVK